jgi:hypothetical protein
MSLMSPDLRRRLNKSTMSIVPNEGSMVKRGANSMFSEIEGAMSMVPKVEGAWSLVASDSGGRDEKSAKSMVHEIGSQNRTGPKGLLNESHAGQLDSRKLWGAETGGSQLTLTQIE